MERLLRRAAATTGDPEDDLRHPIRSGLPASPERRGWRQAPSPPPGQASTRKVAHEDHEPAPVLQHGGHALRLLRLRMPKQDVAAAFAAASIVTSVVIDQPKLGVNSVNKFFDGLAAARPVAVNHGCWQADPLTTHGAGLWLPRDVSQAATVLSARLSDPARLEAAGSAARRLAEERFARELLTDQLERVLLEAQAGRRGS